MDLAAGKVVSDRGAAFGGSRHPLVAMWGLNVCAPGW